MKRQGAEDGASQPLLRPLPICLGKHRVQIVHELFLYSLYAPPNFSSGASRLFRLSLIFSWMRSAIPSFWKRPLTHRAFRRKTPPSRRASTGSPGLSALAHSQTCRGPALLRGNVRYFLLCGITWYESARMVVRGWNMAICWKRAARNAIIVTSIRGAGGDRYRAASPGARG